MKIRIIPSYFIYVFMLATTCFVNCTTPDEEVAPAYDDPGINSFTTILIGNQISTEPSFYSTSTNTRYKIADAKLHAEDIDFGMAMARRRAMNISLVLRMMNL